MDFVATILVPLAKSPASAAAWGSGPLPVPMVSGGVTDVAARSAYFDRRAAAVLYRSTPGTGRRHRWTTHHVDGPFRLDAVEWVPFDGTAALAGVLVAHIAALEDDGAWLSAWSNLVRWRLDDADQSALVRTLESVVGAPLERARAHRSPFRIAFLSRVPSSIRAPSGSPGPPSVDWLFALASAVPSGSFVPAGRQAAELGASVVELSSDWSALVLRDGAAFLGHSQANTSFIEEYAHLFVRTIYTDALLLGVLQQYAFSDLADRVAALDDPARRPRAVERLDLEFSRLRNRLWWQHVTQHGVGNELLLAYQRQHRLPALIAHLRAELEDYSRQAASRAARVMNVFFAVFALIGVLGVGLELFRVYVPAPGVPTLAQVVWSLLLLTMTATVMFGYANGGLVRPWRRGGRRRR